MSKFSDDDLEELYQRYKPIVYKLKKKYYIADMDCDDWLQEGRIIFYQSFASFDMDRGLTLGAYFKKNFDRFCCSKVRYQCAKKRIGDLKGIRVGHLIDNLGQIEDKNVMPIEGIDIDDEVVLQEVMENFPNCLSKFESAVFASYLLGEEEEEIARQLKAQLGAVKGALGRVKMKLHAYIKNM